MDRGLVYQFFADPNNLVRLSPPAVGLQIMHGAQSPIAPGQTLHIRVRPFGWAMDFTSQITQVEIGSLFEDQAHGGLFKRWIHQHRFTDHGNGTMIEDVVHYDVGGGAVGRLMHGLIIRRQMAAMFRFRHRQFMEIHHLKLSLQPPGLPSVVVSRR